MPQEFTPEITQNFFNRLAGSIRERGAKRRGLARSEALARGLTGDPFEASSVAAERGRTDVELANLEADLGFRVAGLQREERIGTESREDIQSFQAAEAEKDRAFRERLSRLGFAQDLDFDKTRRRREFQGDLTRSGIEAGAGLFTRGIGRYFGGR